MKLVILLVSILLQRLNITLFHDRYRLFDQYIKFIKPYLDRFGLTHGWLAILGISAPLLILVWILNAIFSYVGLLYLLFGVLILMICMDVRDVKTKLTDFFNALATENRTRAQVEVEKFTNQPADEDRATMVRVMTGAIFIQSITTIFSVIFWFLLLGPVGAVMYYLVAALSEHSMRSETSESTTMDLAKFLRDIFDWIPVRLVVFTFALIGHFAPIVNLLVEHLGDGVSANANLLIDSGLLALGLSKDERSTEVEENHKAAALVTRTLWTWVIAITVMYVIHWLF